MVELFEGERHAPLGPFAYNWGHGVEAPRERP